MKQVIFLILLTVSYPIFAQEDKGEDGAKNEIINYSKEKYILGVIDAMSSKNSITTVNGKTTALMGMLFDRYIKLVGKETPRGFKLSQPELDYMIYMGKLICKNEAIISQIKSIPVLAYETITNQGELEKLIITVESRNSLSDWLARYK